MGPQDLRPRELRWIRVVGYTSTMEATRLRNLFSAPKIRMIKKFTFSQICQRPSDQKRAPSKNTILENGTTPGQIILSKLCRVFSWKIISNSLNSFSAVTLWQSYQIWKRSVTNVYSRYTQRPPSHLATLGPPTFSRAACLFQIHHANLLSGNFYQIFNELGYGSAPKPEKTMD